MAEKQKYALLRAKMKEQGVDLAYLSRALQMRKLPGSIKYLSECMNCKAVWRMDVVYAIMDILFINTVDMPAYFPLDGKNSHLHIIDTQEEKLSAINQIVSMCMQSVKSVLEAE